MKRFLIPPSSTSCGDSYNSSCNDENIISNSDDTDETPPPPKLSKKITNKNKFNDKWFENSQFNTWLLKKVVNNETVAYCKICETPLTNHKPALEGHLKTNKHKANVNATSKIKPIEKLLVLTKDDQLIKRAEIKVCAFLAQHNLPFSLADSLIPFMADIYPDSKIARKVTLGRTKATNTVTKLLGPDCANSLITKLKIPGTFFSIIMDEATDISSKKQCALAIIMYNDANDKVESKFLDIYETESGKGKDLSDALLNWLNSRQIPFTNFVGFASDTTNSMVGEHNSVFSHLKEKVSNITCVKCSCHMIHLVASYACLKLPRSVEDTLRSIGAHFSRSSKRQSKFKEFQEFFGVELHKILSPSNTRWLSLQSCVDRTLEQYEALKSYFLLEAVEDPSKVTDDIVQALNNEFTRIYLEFMSYTLELLNDFNKLFQTERPLLHRLRPETEKLIRTIASNYMEINHCKSTRAFDIQFKNPRYYLTLEKIYLGPLAHDSIQELLKIANPPKTEIQNFRTSCLNFYIEIISQIKDRFEFKDSIFNILSVLEPKEAQSFEKKDFSDILLRFPILNTIIDEKALGREWREHALLEYEKYGLQSNLPAEEYWRKVFQLEKVAGGIMFPNLRKVFSLLFVLPFSNACVERVFSQLKLIKTAHRNNLHTSTISALMTTKENIKDAIKFEPNTSVLNSKIKY